MVSHILFDYLIKISDELNEIEIVCAVDTTMKNKSRSFRPLKIIKNFVIYLLHKVRKNKTYSIDQKYLDSAKQKKIPIIKPDECNVNNTNFIKKCGDLSPDIILICGCDQILKKDILAIPKITTINYHWSYLPRYRGKNAVFWAFVKGETYTGFTYHHVTERIDEGDIIYQKHVKIETNDTINSLANKLLHEGGESLKHVLNYIIKGQIPSIQMNLQGGEYFGLKDFEYAKYLNFDRDVDETVRIFQNFNRLTFIVNNKKLAVTNLEKNSGDIGEIKSFQNGEVISINLSGIQIKVENGAIIIKKIHHFNSNIIAKILGVHEGYIFNYDEECNG